MADRKRKVVMLTGRQQAMRVLEMAKERKRRTGRSFTRKGGLEELEAQASGASRITQSAARRQRRKKTKR